MYPTYLGCMAHFCLQSLQLLTYKTLWLDSIYQHHQQPPAAAPEQEQRSVVVLGAPEEHFVLRAAKAGLFKLLL